MEVPHLQCYITYLRLGKRWPTEQDDEKDDKLTAKHYAVHVSRPRTHFRVNHAIYEYHYVSHYAISRNIDFFTNVFIAITNELDITDYSIEVESWRQKNRILLFLLRTIASTSWRIDGTTLKIWKARDLKCVDENAF